MKLFGKCPKCKSILRDSNGRGLYCPKDTCKWGWEVEMDGSQLRPPEAAKPLDALRATASQLRALANYHVSAELLRSVAKEIEEALAAHAEAAQTFNAEQWEEIRRKLRGAEAITEATSVPGLRDRGIEAATIMRFRKMLNRIGIHGYYAEMQKEFGDDFDKASQPQDAREAAQAEFAKQVDARIDEHTAFCPICVDAKHTLGCSRLQVLRERRAALKSIAD